MSANDLHIVGKFHIFANKPENAPKIAQVLQQFQVKADPFQGTTQVSFDLEPYALDHLHSSQTPKFADAVFFAGGRFQGVGTYGLNKITPEAKKKCIEEGIPMP